MATIDSFPQTDNVRLLGIPKTRAGVDQQLREALAKKYGISTNQAGLLNYGLLEKNFRKYSSKAGGYVDTRTGAIWDKKYSQTLRKEISVDQKALLTSRRSLAFGGIREGLAKGLARLDRFGKSQGARNKLSDHLESKTSNLWQLRNLSSPKDIDTGKTKLELEWDAKKLQLEQNVARLQSNTQNLDYQVPQNILKIITPKPIDTKGISTETAQIVGGDPKNIALKNKGNTNVQGGAETHQGEATVEVNSKKGPNTVDNSIVTKTNQEKSNEKLKIKGSIERWHMGQNRTQKEANAQTMAWLQEQGYDTSSLEKLHRRDSANVMRDIRIGRVLDMGDKIRVGKHLITKKITEANNPTVGAV